MVRFLDTVSLEEIRRSQERFCTTRGLDAVHTPRNLVLSLVSDVGELCELFQWRQDGLSGSPNDREHKNLSLKLADLLLKTMRISQQCGIDLSEAVLQRQDQLERQHPAIVPRDRSPNATTTRSNVTTPLTDRRVSLTSQQPGTDAPDTAFWEYLRMIESINTPTGESLTEQQFALFVLRFVISSNGQEIELIPNGKNTFVTLATKDRYVRLAREKKHQLDNPTTSGSPTAGPVVGLFSPGLKPTTRSFADSMLALDMSNTTQLPPPSDIQIASAHVNSCTPKMTFSPPPTRSLSPKSLEKFWAVLAAFERETFTDEEVLGMHVAFVIPHNGTHVELLPGGSDMLVTNSNKQDFIRLAKAKAQELGDSGAPLPKASQKRPGLTRSMSVHVPSRVWDPREEARHFSPSHFKVDLFSPFCAETTFDVNSTLNTHLAMVPDSQPPTAPLSPDNMSCSAVRLPLLSIEAQFPSILQSLKKINTTSGESFTEDSFLELGMKFCVPFGNRTIELLPGGANCLVTLDRLPEFLALAESKLSELQV